MGKYESSLKDVFSIFNSASWQAENIETIPENFTRPANSTKYIRVSVVAGGPGVNRLSISGVLLIDIFTDTGGGPLPAMQVADKLDEYLQERVVQTAAGAMTQLFKSSVQSFGVDRDSPELYRVLYTIPFSYFRS